MLDAEMDKLRAEVAQRAGPVMVALRLESTTDTIYVVQAELWTQDRARCFGSGHGEGGTLQEADEEAELDALRRSLAYLALAPTAMPQPAPARAPAPAARSTGPDRPARAMPTAGEPNEPSDAHTPASPGPLPPGLVSAATGTETCAVPGCGQRLSPLMANAARVRFGEVLCSAHVRERTATEPTPSPAGEA